MYKTDASLFAMLRTLVVLIHADGVVDSRELKWFHYILKKFELSTEQLDLLKQDLKYPPALEEVFAQITSSRDRQELIQLAPILFQLDGHFSKAERKIAEQLDWMQRRSELNISDARAVVADSIVSSLNRNQLQQDLAEAAKYYTQRRSYWGFNRIYFQGFISNNPFIFWPIFVLVMVPLIIQIALMIIALILKK